MRIINHTDIEVRYTLKGGPLVMILSTCDLDPGEEEVWETPRWGKGPMKLEIEVQIGETTLVAHGEPEQTVWIEGTNGQWRLRVGA
jgi:hypothetical protein